MRNNQKRLGPESGPQASDVVSPELVNSPLAYAVPTEFVELPSRGQFYPEDHPLYREDTIEIRYMTAKEEDILASATLIKKGIAIDRLIQNLIVDKRINAKSLLVGDRGAIMIAARISSYGAPYDTALPCNSCLELSDFTFDLSDSKLIGECFNESFLKENNIQYDENSGAFVFSLPKSQVSVGLRMTTGDDEADSANKQDKENSIITDILKTLVLSVNGNYDRHVITQFVDSMPARDSKHIREIYIELAPSISISQQFFCLHCASEEAREVVLSADFFWPK